VRLKKKKSNIHLHFTFGSQSLVAIDLEEPFDKILALGTQFLEAIPLKVRSIAFTADLIKELHDFFLRVGQLTAQRLVENDAH
jgi:hypothetical protein